MKKTKTLERAEIFSAGTWNRMSFSESDLDSIISSFNFFSLAGRVPLKLGHEGDDARKHPESQYAMGWVQNIWREGKTLFGRLEIPEKVFSLIEEGFLKNISIELLHDVKAGTRVIPYVLDSVALLGSDQPAVGILKDLQALTMSRNSLEFGSRVAFKRGTSTTRSSTMTPEEEAKLRQDLANAQASNAAITSQFAASEATRKKDQAATRRREIKSTFDNAVRDKKILPKRFESFTKVFKTDDDTRVAEIADGDVETYISTFVDADKAEITKNDKGGANAGTDKDDANKAFIGKPNHEVFASLANAECMKGGGKTSNFRDLQEAGARVMRANPKLAQAYHNDPNGEFAG